MAKASKKTKQQIIKELNLFGFEAKQQDKIIEKLMDNAFKKTVLSILDLLSDDEKKEFEKISKKKGAGLKYLNSKIKDFSSLPAEIARQIVTDFKKLRKLT